MGYTPRKFNLSPKLKLGVGRGVTLPKILKFFGGVFVFFALLLTAHTARLVWQHTAFAKNQSPNPEVLGDNTGNSDIDENNNNYFEFIEYIVQKGDTLFNVSQAHNIKWTTLATINDLQSPFTLKPGQIIKIPKQ